MKRIISILLSALMVVMIIPVSVFMVAAEDQVLYSNDFSDPANGADSQDANVSITGGQLAFTYNGPNKWTKNVALNGTDGEVTISFTLYPNWNRSYPVVRVNGVAAITACSSYQVKLGDDTSAYNSATNKAVYVTITVDPTTGAATVTYDQAEAGYTVRSDSFNVGTVGESLSIVFGADSTNGFKIDDLVVNQVIGSAIGGSEPEPDPNAPLLEVGEIAYAGWTGSSESSYTVNTNGTNGAITITFSVAATLNWQNTGVSVFAVNGTPLIKSSGASGSAGYIMGTDGTEVRTWSARTFTMVIDPATGAVQLSDGTGTATANVGPIGDSFSIKVGTGGSLNSWTQAALVVTQEAPAEPEIECNVWVDGHQKTAVDGGKYNVRFVAGVGELVAGQTVIGFEIAVPAQSKSWDKVTSTVYNSITANYGTKTVLASEIGAEYVTAIAITGIPADLGEVVFTVRPYTIINGETVYGETVTVTVTP